MKEIRKKQKKLFSLMKALTIFTAVLLFVYIGAKPYVAEFNANLAVIINYICDIIVIISLIVIFLYYSRYGKLDYIFSCAEDEINDSGCYLTARTSRDFDEYKKEIYQDLRDNRFNISENVEGINFNFDIIAFKAKEYFYLASVDSVDKNDILAYIDEAINNLTVKNLKRKGNAVVTFITDNADESAVALSKMITPIGKKNQLKIAIAIVELSTGRVYFNGSKETGYKKLIANFVMNCDIPIKENYIVRDKLPFQYDLEERLDKLTLKDFKTDNFYIH